MGIYQRIGGARHRWRRRVEILVVKVLGDPALAPLFASVDLARLKAHQRAFLTASLGGPRGYGGRSMAEAHAGQPIDHVAFAAFVGHLVATLIELGIPDETIAEIEATLAPLEADIVTAEESGGLIGTSPGRDIAASGFVPGRRPVRSVTRR